MSLTVDFLHSLAQSCQGFPFLQGREKHLECLGVGVELGLHCCQKLVESLLLPGEGGYSDLISCGTKDDIIGVQIQSKPVRILELWDKTSHYETVARVKVLPRKKKVAWYQCIILRGGGRGALESPPPPS